MWLLGFELRASEEQSMLLTTESSLQPHHPVTSFLQNEFPVPEQFKTLWNGQKLVTTVTEIAG